MKPLQMCIEKDGVVVLSSENNNIRTFITMDFGDLSHIIKHNCAFCMFENFSSPVLSLQT